MKKNILLLVFYFFLIGFFLLLFKNSVFSFQKDKFLENKYIEDEIIVKYKGDEKPFRLVKVPAGQVKEKIKEYRKKKEVEYAEPNYLAYAQFTPNDPYYSYQWHFQNSSYGGIQVEKAWEIASGSGVIVAVVDTGVAYEDYQQGLKRYCKAPDFNQTCFVEGWDFVNNDSHPNDDNNHGTHVAGTIAQSTNNNLGVAGIAWKSCLMPLKALDKTGTGTYANIASAIRWAADHQAKVINLSLGGTADSQTLKDAVVYAYQKGVTIVAACGNENKANCLYPAAYDDYVIAVGATQYDETKAPYSNYGPSLDLVAPGGNLSVDQNNDGYGDGILQQTFESSNKVCNFGYYFFQGTSMATPHVAGVAALLISAGKANTPEEVRNILQQTAEDKGAPGRDDIYGWGLVNAAAALGIAITPTPTPEITPTPTATPSPIPTFTPTPTPSSQPTPTPTPTSSPSGKCWSGEYQYLYRNSAQFKKFCKCASGTYGYKNYRYTWGRQLVYYYVDSSDSENWAVASRTSNLPVYKVTCPDGFTYPTNQDYFWPK